MAGWLHASVAAAQDGRRGLLAGAPFDLQPVKGMYFFPGETWDEGIYTAHPIDDNDKHWLTRPHVRASVIDRIVRTNTNVLVLSYWSNMPQWSPMNAGPTPIEDVISASAGKRIVIMPAIEGGFDPKNPQIPHFEFHADFPYAGRDAAPANLAPGLLLRIRQVIRAFRGHMGQWARIYDRHGTPRYAIHILHAFSDRVPPVAGRSADQVFAEAFQAVADAIWASDNILIGFTLDVIPGPQGTYTAAPRTAGPGLERVPAVLAIQGFASEVFSGKIINGPPNGAPCDNNRHNNASCNNNQSNLYSIVDWKARALHDWIVSRVPVIYDVSSGFDGRKVWKEFGAGFWGDNADYTDDRWRNALSQFKGNGIKGITFNTWNGYTEGYAAAPTREHGQTVYNWVRDLYEPDPRHCSHMQYVNGRATHRVYGAICEAWVKHGGDRGLLGPPLTPELASAKGRVTHFQKGSIYWGPSTGAHEVHGRIADAYREVAADGSCLGLPISDEEPNGPNGRISRFQGGVITFRMGDQKARVQCR